MKLSMNITQNDENHRTPPKCLQKTYSCAPVLLVLCFYSPKIVIRFETTSFAYAV